MPTDVEIVLSSYREDPSLVSEQIQVLQDTLKRHGWSSRTIVYSKDEAVSFDQIEPLRRKLGADEVRLLPNTGREGGTFLTHITSQYDLPMSCKYSASRHILFAQSILESQDLLESRISSLHRNTAFMSLGRYAKSRCGSESHGKMLYFPRMRDIYSIFTGNICPNTEQLCTYKGQFIVSRQQILRSPKRYYQHLIDIIQAPQGHWIYEDAEDQAWEYRGHKSSPSSPFFGHAVERSWPVIFNCTDPTIADSCSAENSVSCQCVH